MPSAYLIVVGFLSLLAQTVLLRELSVAFYGVELIYTLALGAWLLFGAFGAMMGRRAGIPSAARIRFLLLLVSVVLPLEVAFIRASRLLVSGVPGAYLPLHTQIGLMCACLLPVGLMLGLLFQGAAAAYVAPDRSLAAAYGIESLGAMAGGICATLLLQFGCPNFAIALLCAIAAAAASLLRPGIHRAAVLRPASVAALGVLGATLWLAAPLDRRMTAWAHPDLVETRDTPYSRVTVTSRHGQVAVFENDALGFDTESTRAEEFVHLAALEHPAPRKVLVLGGGIEGTVREVLRHSPGRVDYVEQNPALLHIVPGHLPGETRRSLRDPRVRIVHADPRRFLESAPAYDLILVGMPEPASGQANRFFTREFFESCRARLGANGVMAFSLQSSENFWTPQLARRMRSIHGAALAAFPDVVFLPGRTNVVLCSRGRLTRDPSVQAARLDSRGIRPRLVSAAYLRYVYTNDRFREVARSLENGTAPVNTDARPICYQYTVLLWLSKFIPASARLDLSPPAWSAGALAAWGAGIFLPFLLLMRAPWPVRRTVLAGIAGFAGMGLEVILLLNYQTRNGILFQDIGLLMTGFMAGLAAGALAAARMGHRLTRRAGFALLALLASLSAAAGARIPGGGLAETLGFLALAGFCVAGIFAYAGLKDARDQRRVVAPLYAADLIGGCMASILCSLVLAPLAGLDWTAFLMIPVAILSALLL